MKQHSSPCGGCPFSRAIAPGELGGGRPETYVGQAVGPFWLPCHCSANYRGKETVASEVSQCAGAAIFRANIGVQMPPALLSLPRDTEKVFSTLADFWSHHTKTSRINAVIAMRPSIVRELAERELADANVKLQLIPRP